MRGGNAKRWQIREHHRCLLGAKEIGLRGHARVEARHEIQGPFDGRPRVKMQAVDLHNTGVGFDRHQLDSRMRGSLEQPGRDLGSDHHAKIWSAIDEGVDQLN